MNLTSKRLLKMVLACAGVCALSASALDYAADSFETPEGSENLPAREYKMTVSGEQSEITNFVWTAADGDASKLVLDETNKAFDGTGTRPMSGVASNLVLNLETEGQTLTRQLGVTNNFLTGGPVYVDTLIKFTPSEDDPVIEDTMVKAAVFVNVQSNLVIYSNTEGGLASTDVGYAIDPEEWYRLTIVLTQIDSTPLFSVYINGVAITNGVAFDDEGAHPGPWFLSAAPADTTVSAVAFQGTGMVDELVVTDTMPTFGSGTSVLITLAFNDTLVSVTQGGNPVANNGTVPTGTEIVIDAADWYEITSATGAGDGTFSGTVGALVNVSTGTVSATASDTVTIAVDPYSASTGINTGLGAETPADKVAAWALANALDEGDLEADMLDDYLLNVAPDTDAELEITSIVVGEDEVTITVAATDVDVDFTAINGTLTIYTTDELDEAFAEIATFSIEVLGEDEVTITVPIGDGKFIKAVVE